MNFNVFTEKYEIKSKSKDLTLKKIKFYKMIHKKKIYKFSFHYMIQKIKLYNQEFSQLLRLNIIQTVSSQKIALQ